jgi:hypothetical protein
LVDDEQFKKIRLNISNNLYLLRFRDLVVVEIGLEKVFAEVYSKVLF